MKYRYITLEREFGSGGTQIARSVAKNCQIACYGREILERVADKYHISIDEIDRYEESVTNSFLYTVFVLGRVRSGESDMLAREGHVFIEEQAVISELAAQGAAVFIGHCASEALRDQSGVLRVFIRSDAEDKTERVMEEYGIAKSRVESTMRRYDKKRANYYYANTAKKWTDPGNYDLILDSGKLGVSGCAAAITGVFMQNS